MLRAVLNNPANSVITGGSLTNVTISRKQVHTAVTAADGTTLTAASMVGGYITRSGPAIMFTDTTATAADIIAAIPNALTGTCFELIIINMVAFTCTIAAGTGVTLAGTTTLAASSTRRYLGTVTSATTVELRGIHAGGL